MGDNFPTREDWEDRLLGVKVCIQDLLEIMPKGDRYAVFDKALDLALLIEDELTKARPDPAKLSSAE